MKIIVAPDSYKGSLSANEVAEIIEKGINRSIPSAEVILKPMSDGGEGMLDGLIEALDGEKIELTCKGPLGNEITTHYGVINEDTAIIEIAEICGLTLVPKTKRNPENTTTFGVGEAIIDSLDRNIKKIIIGLGGSATNDGGYGMLNALGIKGLDSTGKRLNIFGSDLYNLDDIDWSNLDPRLKDTSIVVANDVNNPLCGKEGASYTYGEQKGATKEQIIKLDQAIFKYAKLIEEDKKKEFKSEEGSGAAGGLGFGLLAIDAYLTSGAELIANKLNIESSIASADLVITGEGKSDEQTLHGKAPIYVSRLANKYNIPSMLISGSVENDNVELAKSFTSMFSIINEPMTVDEAMNNAKSLLYNQVVQIMRLINQNEIK